MGTITTDLAGNGYAAPAVGDSGDTFTLTNKAGAVLVVGSVRTCFNRSSSVDALKGSTIDIAEWSTELARR